MENIFKEIDSKCDRCSQLKECRADGIVVDVTTKYDERDHFTIGAYSVCPLSKIFPK